MADCFQGLGVEVYPLSREEFLKVRETLTRIGTIVGDKTLNQTCYILHKKGRYSIMHYQELRILDGEIGVMRDEDVAHRNTVSFLLDRWGLVEIMDIDPITQIQAPVGGVSVIPYRDKNAYQLKPLYEIGRPRVPAY
jgi:hypothetical protein